VPSSPLMEQQCQAKMEGLKPCSFQCKLDIPSSLIPSNHLSIASRPVEAKHLEGLYIVFYVFPNINPFGPSAPSSHRMRDNPLLGQYTLKSQEIRKWGEIVMESGKYGWERYDSVSREFLTANPSPRKTTY
jgi:hypothetical protein